MIIPRPSGMKFAAPEAGFPMWRGLIIVAMLCPAPAARAGAPEDDFRLGLSAYNVGDYAAAFRYWRPLAERSEPRAQAGIGFMYHRGLGVAIDDREAAVWLRRAAELEGKISRITDKTAQELEGKPPVQPANNDGAPGN